MNNFLCNTNYDSGNGVILDSVGWCLIVVAVIVCMQVYQ